jgi:hypothetical protein
MAGGGGLHLNLVAHRHADRVGAARVPDADLAGAAGGRRTATRQIAAISRRPNGGDLRLELDDRAPDVRRERPAGIVHPRGDSRSLTAPVPSCQRTARSGHGGCPPASTTSTLPQSR